MELFFNMYKVKYTVLNKLLIEKDIIKSDTNNVNVFINLEPLLMRLFTSEVNKYVSINKTSDKEFISNIINLAAHYKMFFTKKKIYSRIFIMIPSYGIEYKNSDVNPEYRMYSSFKFSTNEDNNYVSRMILSSLKTIKVIIEYIKDVYFIESGSIENSVTPFIINKEQNDDKVINFIVTSDMYDFQYVNYNFNIIIPKGDNSIICVKDNIIEYIQKKYMNNIVKYSFSSSFLPFIFSVVGNKTRNIYNVKGIGLKSIFKLIQTAINKDIIANDMSNIYLLLSIVKNNAKELINNNYKVIDIPFQYSKLSKVDIYYIISQIKDKFDNIELRKLNDNYFQDYPIMIQEITMPATKNKIIF